MFFCYSDNGKFVYTKTRRKTIYVNLLVFVYITNYSATPANSGSTKIRPQCSQTMIFLRKRISN